MTNAFLPCYTRPGILSRGARARRLLQYLALLLISAHTESAFAKPPQPLPQSILTYDDGDLFLGFRATDRTSDYLINIGQPTQFVNASPGASFLVAIGNAGPDLITAFGSDWYTRIDVNTGQKAVSWAVVGGRQVQASGDPENTLYSTNPQSTSWPSRSNTAQSFTSSLLAAMGNTFAGNNSTANNPNGLIQGATSTNSYASFQPGGVNSGGISFQTWNPANDSEPATALFFDRVAPNACATVLGTFSLNSSAQLTFTATLSPAPVNVSGTILYCSNPSNPPISGVTLTLTGAMSGSTTSNIFGNYSLSSLPSGGNYIITPSKAPLLAGAPGITTVDVVAVQRHFLNIALLPPGCRLTAADVNGDTNINTSDVIAIQRFALGQGTGVANTGKYQFTPTSRTYQGLFCSRTGQNFDALVFGDVASGFIHRPGGSSEPDATGGMNADEVTATVAQIALPEGTIDESTTKFVAEVATSHIDAVARLVAFQGDFTFDERVVTFESEPVQRTGLTRGNWNVSGNVLDGLGPIRTLRVSAYSNDFAPLSGSGTLFELRVIRVGKEGQSTPLLWAAPPNQFVFIDADLNVQQPGNTAHGSITTSTPQK